MLSMFRNFFFVKAVEDESEREKEERLRFEVYCVEKQWLDSKDYLTGRETDEYDGHSVRLIALSPTAEAAGTMRLILNGGNPLPVMDHFGIEMPKSQIVGEISRLTVAK